MSKLKSILTKIILAGAEVYKICILTEAGTHREVKGRRLNNYSSIAYRDALRKFFNGEIENAPYDIRTLTAER